MEAKTKSGPSPRQGKKLGLTLLLTLSNDSSPSEMTNQASDLTRKNIPEALEGPRKEECPLCNCSPYVTDAAGYRAGDPECNLPRQALPGRPHLFRVPWKTKKTVNPFLLYLALDNNEGQEDSGKEVLVAKATPTAAGVHCVGPLPKANGAHHDERLLGGCPDRTRSCCKLPLC